MYTLQVKISKLPVLTHKDKVRGAAVANTDRGWKKSEWHFVSPEGNSSTHDHTQLLIS